MLDLSIHLLTPRSRTCFHSFLPVVDRRKFRSQTSDNMDRWKAEQGRGREKRKIRRKKSRRERVRRKKMQMREKVGKSRNTVFFQWFVAPEGRKVGSLKRRVRSQLARWEMKNCTPLWREAHLEVKMYKTPQRRTTFGSWDVEKVHAVVARSTFPSQNVQNTLSVGPLLEVEMSKKCTPLWREAHFQVKIKTHHVGHFWKLRCQKVHAVVARSTFRSQNGPLLEVEMSKKCTPLWREAHFEVKMYKTHHVRTTFGGSDVEKVHAVVARSTFRSQNVQNTRGSDHFWRFRCRFASLHYTTLHYTTLHYTTLHLHYTTSSTLHYTTVHSTTLNYTTPHYITPHYITLNDTAPQIDRDR